PLCAGVFSSIRHPALGWPGTALVLCGAQPAVVEILMHQGVARRLALYPSLDQALAHAPARPSWRREQLGLEPGPTAGPGGRAFVRGIWGGGGLQQLADPAALLASELVALAMLHAGTAMELRVDLRGPWLHVAVHDHDPDLLGLLATTEESDRRLSLLIMDQVATSWGVRQDGAGGKTAWCALKLRTTTSTADHRGEAGSGATQATGLPGPGLVWSKLVAPTPRAGLVPRASLQSLLQAGLETKLCLVEAPAGVGKTILLAQWRAART